MTRYAKLVRAAVAAGALLGVAGSVSAHPAPFSFIDVRIQSTTVVLEVVVHAFDVAYVLGIQPPDQVLRPAGLGGRGARSGRFCCASGCASSSMGARWTSTPGPTRSRCLNGNR